MRLTNFMRDAFIRAAMQDVPQIDFDLQAEKVVKDALAKLFNKEFPALDYAKCSQNAWFNHNNTNTPGTLRSFSVVTPSYDYLKLHDQKTWKVLEDLSKKKHEQAQQRSALESQLRSVAYSCTTRKALTSICRLMNQQQHAICRWWPMSWLTSSRQAGPRKTKA